MLGANQEFCLKWNNHKTALKSIFVELFEAEELFDCKIAAEGGSVRAHRILLSACSPYFKVLFSDNADGFPILILKDVKYKQLCTLVDYMYRGEIIVFEDEMAELLLVAESLKIRGLSVDSEMVNSFERYLASPQPSQHLFPGSSPTVAHRPLNDEIQDDSMRTPMLTPVASPVPTPVDSPGPRKRARRRLSEEKSGLGQRQMADVPFLECSVVVERLQVTPSPTAAKTAPVILQTKPRRPLVWDSPAVPVVVAETVSPIQRVDLVDPLLLDVEPDDDVAYGNVEDEVVTSGDVGDVDDSQSGSSYGGEESRNQDYVYLEDVPAEGMEGSEAGTDEEEEDEDDDDDEYVENDDRFQCQKCSRMLASQANLKFHQIKCGKVALFECPTCKRKLMTNKALTKHLDEGCDKVSTCEKCSMVFRYKYDFKRHMKSVCGTETTCEKCSKVFKFRRAFNRHMEIGCLYHCPKCTKPFGTKHSLQHHINMCGKVLIKCDQCETTFNSRKSLKLHSKACGPVDGYTCLNCFQVCKYKKGFDRHNESQCLNGLVCRACKKVFDQKNDLLGHLKEGCKAVVKCERCHKCFTHKNKLTRHKKEGCKAVVQCKLCLQRFTHKNQLTQHKKELCVISSAP